jgi:hypothetical protein
VVDEWIRLGKFAYQARSSSYLEQAVWSTACSIRSVGSATATSGDENAMSGARRRRPVACKRCLPTPWKVTQLCYAAMESGHCAADMGRILADTSWVASEANLHWSGYRIGPVFQFLAHVIFQ